VQFEGWNALGFAPPFPARPTTTFHPKGRGEGVDHRAVERRGGVHTATFSYTIVTPNRSR
jgi:hypothetical protein